MASLEPITIPVNTNQIQMAIGQVNKLENQIVRLEKARQRGIITEQQYDAALDKVSKRMNRFAVDTKQAEQEIVRFGNAIKGANIQTLNNLGRGLQESQKGFARFGLAAQQAGYQVGDFFVQVASGTNPMVAFTQQFAQLAGFFGGPWGAVVGAVAAIGGAAYIAFTRASEGVETFQQSLENAKKTLEEQEFDFSVAQGGFASEEQKRLYDALVPQLAELNRLEGEAAKLREQQGMGAAIALGLKNDEVDAQRILVDEAIQQIDAMTKAADEAERHAEDTKLIEKGLSQSVISALKLAGVDMSNLSDAALHAYRLASNMAISLGFAQQLVRLSELSPEDRSIYTGVKTGLLPDAALNTIGMGGGGFTTDANAPIEIPGALPDNPGFPKKTRSGGDKKDPLEQLRQQLKLQNELLGVSEAQARVIQALGQDRSKYSEAEINALTAEVEAYNQKLEAIERTKQIMDTVKSSMEEAFMAMVDGTMSAKDAFKSMAVEIIRELYRILVVQQLVNSIAGFLMPSAAPTSSPRPMPRPSGVAVGGSIMAGGSYLVGENGPELVIPRHSGTVVNANQTAAMGGGSGAVTVNNNISVTGSDAAMVRTEIAKMIPQITNATKAAVIDARLRGGQMKAAFQ